MTTTTLLQKEATAPQNIKNQLKSSMENKKIQELNRKLINGQFYQDLERPSVNKSLLWLCSLGLKGEMESLIIAVQD
jgi:hypothetical protein